MQRLRRSAALCTFGAIGLASITFTCYRLQFNVATAGFTLHDCRSATVIPRMGDLVSAILYCHRCSLLLGIPCSPRLLLSCFGRSARYRSHRSFLDDLGRHRDPGVEASEDD